VFRSVAIALCVLFAMYVGVYVSLSVQGSYEPQVYSKNRWSYMWEPRGFTDAGGRWRSFVPVFAPLYWLDVHFWHTENTHQESLRYFFNILG
jgi:hypothetical protein